MIYAYIIYRSIVGWCARDTFTSLSVASRGCLPRITWRNSSKTSRRKHQVISPIRSVPAAYPFRLSLLPRSRAAPPPSLSPALVLLYVPGLLSLHRLALLFALSPFPAPNYSAPKRLYRHRGFLPLRAQYLYNTALRASLQLASHPVHPATGAVAVIANGGGGGGGGGGISVAKCPRPSATVPPLLFIGLIFNTPR